MKRIFDFSMSLIGILILLPIFLIIALIIYLQDFSNPLYIAKRVGLNGNNFNIIK